MQLYENLFCKYLRNYLKASSGYEDLRCKHHIKKAAFRAAFCFLVSFDFWEALASLLVC